MTIFTKIYAHLINSDSLESICYYLEIPSTPSLLTRIVPTPSIYLSNSQTTIDVAPLQTPLANSHNMPASRQASASDQKEGTDTGWSAMTWISAWQMRFIPFSHIGFQEMSIIHWPVLIRPSHRILQRQEWQLGRHSMQRDPRVVWWRVWISCRCGGAWRFGRRHWDGRGRRAIGKGYVDNACILSVIMER